MNPIKQLESMGAKFTISKADQVITYDISEVDCSKGKEAVAHYLFEIKANKAWAIDYLLNNPKDCKKIVAIDIETTAKTPEDGEIVLIGYADNDQSFATQDIESMREILKDKKICKVFHNATFDVMWLEEKGYEVNNYTDTMIISLVINNRVKQENSLAYLAFKYLGLRMCKSLQSTTNWQDGITEAHKDYCKKDAEITFQLYGLLMSKIESLLLDGVLRREIRALPAVVELNRTGMKFDFKGWINVLKECAKEKCYLEEEIKKIFCDKDININSPLQLKKALEGIGITVESTCDEALAKYEEDYEVVRLLRRYKKLKKMLSSFGQKFKEKLNKDGTVKGNWRLIGANTFRMTCTKPNLQGMPRQSKEFFRAREGNVFVIADYSQIELRVLAHLANDPLMIEAFNNGEDLHKKTASMILGKDVLEVSKEERQIAKTANFGLVYGMSAYGLRKKIKAEYGTEMTLEEAERVKNGYFNTYKGVLEFQDRMLRADKITTLGGRRWDVTTGELKRGSIARYNYPVQGTAAEGLKESLALLTDSKKTSWKIAAVVHDEIVLEVPSGEEDEAKELLGKVMKKGMSQLVDRVPIEVDITVSKVWCK